MSQVVAQGAPNPTQAWSTTRGAGAFAQRTFGAASKTGETMTIPIAGMSTVLICGFKAAGGSPSITLFMELSMDGRTWVRTWANQITSPGGLAQFANLSVGSAFMTAYPYAAITNVAGWNYFRLNLAGTPSGQINVQVQASSSNSGTVIPAGSTPGSQSVALSNSVIGGISLPNNFQFQASQVAGTSNAATVRTQTSTGVMTWTALCILISVTAGGSATGTLQLFLQDSFDGGTTWEDLVADSTFAFGAATRKHMFIINGRANYGVAVTSTAVTVGYQGSPPLSQVMAANSARQGPIGGIIQVLEVVTGTSGSPAGPTYQIDAVAHI